MCTGYGDRVVCTGYGDRVVCADGDNHVVCAGYGDRVVCAGCDNHVVCAGYGDRVVCASCPPPSSYQSSKWYNLLLLYMYTLQFTVIECSQQWVNIHYTSLHTTVTLHVFVL